VADPTLTAELLHAVIVEMIRDGIVPPEIIERVGLQFEAEARAFDGNSRAERYETLARMATGLLLTVAAPTSSEWRAERQRGRLHLIVPADGGKAPD
jgi:hypothetical protein